MIGKPDEKNPNDPSRSTIKQYLERSGKTISNFVKGFEEPAFDKLLPDVKENDPHKKPYTLVIDLDKFLICHIWDPELAKWRIAKRPFAELFLFYMAQLYEIVVFSSLTHFEGDNIVKKLDPFGCIAYSLYRYATHYQKGVYIKDIGKLNRDLSKVIVLGHDTKGFSVHPENVIPTPEWTGNPEDGDLEELIDFFETLAFSNTKDVRPIIAKYSGLDIVKTFDSLQERMYEDIRKSHVGVFKKAQKAIYHTLGWEVSEYDSDNPPYHQKKETIRQLRREEYEKAKNLMMEQLKIEMEKEKQYLAQHKMPFFDMITKGAPPPPQSIAANDDPAAPAN